MKRDSNFRWSHTDAASIDLKGIEVAIIGGTGGIGRAFSRLLSSRGANVLVVGQTFRDFGVQGIEFIRADLSLMREAQRVATILPAETLDLVLFTTGIFAAPTRQETAEGIERDMAVSYLSRLVIAREMAPRLGKGRNAAAMKPRVFIVGYPGTGRSGTLEDLNAERSYNSMTVHVNTVAGNEMLVMDCAKRYPNASFFGLNPGTMKTGIRANFMGADTLKYRLVEWLIGLTTPSPDDYAERLTPLLVSRDLEGRSGMMFDRKGRAILPSRKLTDDTYVSQFIAASEALLARANVRLAS